MHSAPATSWRTYNLFTRVLVTGMAVASLFGTAAHFSAGPDSECAQPLAWVLDSEAFAANIVTKLSTQWIVRSCGFEAHRCQLDEAPCVHAIIGSQGGMNGFELDKFESLKVLQDSAFFFPNLTRVPCHVPVSWYFPDYQQQYGSGPIAEFTLAAMFQRHYQLTSRSQAFYSCSFQQDTPTRCPTATEISGHTLIQDLTVGIMGLGQIGSAIAKRVHPLGCRVIASKRHGPFVPPPPNVDILTDDNELLFREADVIINAIGPYTPSTIGFLNATGMRMMKHGATMVVIDPLVTNFTDMFQVLKERPDLYAFIDVHKHGCAGFPDSNCGPPYGVSAFPTDPKTPFETLPNVMLLPWVAGRDNVFWHNSAKFVAANLDAIVEGRQLAGVLNRSDPSSFFLPLFRGAAQVRAATCPHAP